MRLTQIDREGVVRRALAARFDPARVLLAQDKEALALRLYDIAISDDTLRDEHMALAKRESDLKDEAQRAESQLNALLGRVTTLGRLREIWPEGEPFYAHLAPRDRIDVPAVQVSDINKLLGLAA